MNSWASLAEVLNRPVSQKVKSNYSAFFTRCLRADRRPSVSASICGIIFSDGARLSIENSADNPSSLRVSDSLRPRDGLSQFSALCPCARCSSSSGDVSPVPSIPAVVRGACGGDRVPSYEFESGSLASCSADSSISTRQHLVNTSRPWRAVSLLNQRGARCAQAREKVGWMRSSFRHLGERTKEEEESQTFSDTDEARFERLLRAAEAEPEALAWVDVVQPSCALCGSGMPAPPARHGRRAGDDDRPLLRSSRSPPLLFSTHRGRAPMRRAPCAPRRCC